MTKIIGFAGKKKAGKNACCNLILMLKMLEDGICESARFDKDGNIEVTDVLGQKGDEKYILFKEPYVNVDYVINSWGNTKIYSLAYPFKEICVNILGLDADKVYGNDEDKTTMTDFQWKDMPGSKKVKGKLSIRQLLQFLGTEMFRSFYPNVWVDSLLRRVEQDNFKMALISDLRFENEMNIIKEKGGLVIGLTRDEAKSKDKHPSEQINLDLCDVVIDNKNMTISEQNEKLYHVLVDHGVKLLPVV